MLEEKYLLTEPEKLITESQDLPKKIVQRIENKKNKLKKTKSDNRAGEVRKHYESRYGSQKVSQLFSQDWQETTATGTVVYKIEKNNGEIDGCVRKNGRS